MSSLLMQLKKMTEVVADTGDLSLIAALKPRDVTTNPSLLTTALKKPESADLVSRALAEAKKEGGDVVAVATDYLAVELGLHVLSLIEGRVSTEVDARLSYDTEATIKKAKRLISLYASRGMKKERVLIKIASTLEGIKAAQQLEKEGIHCNLTLLFGLHQAAACAEANVTLISPFVGRILDWHKKATGKSFDVPAEDPGVISVTEIYNYYKHFDYKTEIMGASFRNLGEIIELAGCDLLTIAPNFIEELAKKEETLVQKLDATRARGLRIQKLDQPLDKELFRIRHEHDKMATDKLAEGIAGFTKALEELEGMVQARLQGKS